MSEDDDVEKGLTDHVEDAMDFEQGSVLVGAVVDVVVNPFLHADQLPFDDPLKWIVML